MKFKGKKRRVVQKLILEALELLDEAEIELPATDRAREKLGMVFLAVAGINSSDDWKESRKIAESRAMTTREIIQFINENFGESISSGSYDDIRRKDLVLPVLAGIVVQSSPDSATNDPSRGYRVSADFLLATSLMPNGLWKEAVANFVAKHGSLKELLSKPRSITTVPVRLTSGEEFTLSPGKHNELQKAIIEEFLPRFVGGAELLYLGDTANKALIIDRETLRKLDFFELDHRELPDVVAYDSSKNWLFLIEAVHSSGPMSKVRAEKLARLTKECKAGIVYVTAFLSRAALRKWVADIAWESEVWISEEPDHMIHFDGDRFLGPY